MFPTVRRSTAARPPSPRRRPWARHELAASRSHAPRPPRGRGAHGWTQAELLVAMAIGAMLLTLALPHYRTWLAAYELRNAAEQLAAGMAVARSEAIKRGHRVNLCKSADRRHCADSGSWDAGWVLYADLNVDGRVDDDEPLLRSDGPVRPGIRVVANRPLDDYVSYTSLGHARLLDGALQMGSFRVCRAGQAAWKVVLANSGRVRLERTGEPCA